MVWSHCAWQQAGRGRAVAVGVGYRFGRSRNATKASIAHAHARAMPVRPGGPWAMPMRPSVLRTRVRPGGADDFYCCPASRSGKSVKANKERPSYWPWPWPWLVADFGFSNSGSTKQADPGGVDRGNCGVQGGLYISRMTPAHQAALRNIRRRAGLVHIPSKKKI